MERAHSAPEPIKLTNEDYCVPRHGVGLTGPARKLQLGTFAKDKGEFSSRLGQVMKQAAKTPGPGKYIGHTQWVTAGKVAGTRNIYETVTRFGAAFEKCSREHKPLNKVPPPPTYERKDFSTSDASIGAKDNLSTKHRVVLGRASKGPKRSFLDNVAELGKLTPAPGQYNTPNCVPRNKLEIHCMGPSFDVKLTESRKPPQKQTPGPDHYKPNFNLGEHHEPQYTCPRDQGNNFVDKAVKAKWVDKKTQMPAPGKHDLINLSKISRGTKATTLQGLGRSVCSGYF